MDFKSYQLYFQSILNGEQTTDPYSKPAYLNYTKLNWSRQQRWLKIGELDSELLELVKNIENHQQWVVITEPWCGDAAHILPFIYRLTELNSLIKLDILLRDTSPYIIEKYLTGKSKSIPKLIIRDNLGGDLVIWGPRPLGCQQLYNSLIAEQADAEEIKLQIQGWYNQDKGKSFQQELLAALTAIMA